MNWLTTQLDHIDGGVASLEVVSREQEGSTLRRVDYNDLLTVLPPELRRSLRNRDLAKGFALLEGAADARVRYERAVASWDPPPDLFTVAIDDESGNVLYLPQDGDTQQVTLQLFTFQRAAGSDHKRREDGLSRLRALGAFADQYAIVELIEIVEPEGCSDGPCAEWGDGCGNDCVCHRFEIHTPPRRGRVYGLRCR